MANDQKPVISVRKLRKVYMMGQEHVVALHNIDLDIPRGEVCCIFGTSGSGKSTLLNQLAGLEKPTRGVVRIGGVPISQLNENQLAAFRQKHIGFVFQSYNLLPELTAAENVAMPLMFKGVDPDVRLLEAKKMLCRVYGTAFPKASELEAHLNMLEEAKKRDHNKLGRELELFTTVDIIGQGLPILLPKGAKIIQILQRFVEDEEARRGWQLTKTPYMAKRELYKLSGHWDHYLDGMFVLGDPNDETKECFALRPMTCPFQYQAYLNRARSYRDLPLRYNETSTLFRNEDSGEMHGLIRVRQFTISEGHLMCTPEQLEQEFRGCLELAIYMLKTLGLYEDVSYRFSQWDPDDRDKYIGTPEQWDEAQGVMKKILDHLEIPYKIGIGEAAFYGPKLDIQIKNVYGKEDTLITIQIDQMLAEKFGMEYVDRDGVKKNPYIIHRTSIGCYERTLALLIEKYAGAFPMWLAPVQVKLLTIADRHCDYAYDIKRRLEENGIRAEVDDRNEKIGYKIREARLQKVPYMLIIGDNEVENGTLSVRERGENGDLGSMTADEFIERAVSEDKSRIIK